MQPAHSASSQDPVRFEHDERVAVVTLDMPASRNALSLAMIEALSAAVERVNADPMLHVAMITGVGPALSAGHDLRELNAHRNDSDGGGAFFSRTMGACADLMQAIVASPKPFIAVIEGVATAAGCQLVAACDLAVAGENARFALPGVNIGLFCTSPLVAVGRTISRKHAMEMALTGALYSAQEAERFGLVNRVAPAGTAFGHARALALEIARHSAATIGLGKRAFYRQIELPLEEAYRVASEAMVTNLVHPDCAEGVRAFLEKRPPHWQS